MKRGEREEGDMKITMEANGRAYDTGKGRKRGLVPNNPSALPARIGSGP